MFSHLFNTYEAVTPPPKSKPDLKQEIYQEPDQDTLIIDPLGLGPISRVPSVDKPSDQPFVPEPQFDFEQDEVQETPEYSTNNQLISNIINTGRSLLGGRYTYGGTSPNSGLDCSAFLQYIFKQNGVNIPRDTSGIFKAGKEVSLSNAQPGDIICSKGSGPSGRHVQMVSRVDPENNQIYVIEAKGKKYGIVEGPLTKKKSDIISVRRILNQNNQDPFLANRDIQSPTPTTGKFQKAGKLPIGNQKQYDYATEIYQSFVDNGAAPQAALDLTNLVIAEGGWFEYATGDGKKFKNASDLTRHVIGHHQRMFPDSLKATDWNSFYRGLNVTPKYKYNSEKPDYKQWLYQSRPGIRKRINYYRSQKGLSPLAY